MPRKWPILRAGLGRGTRPKCGKGVAGQTPGQPRRPPNQDKELQLESDSLVTIKNRNAPSAPERASQRQAPLARGWLGPGSADSLRAGPGSLLLSRSPGPGGHPHLKVGPSAPHLPSPQLPSRISVLHPLSLPPGSRTPGDPAPSGAPPELQAWPDRQCGPLLLLQPPPPLLFTAT